MSYARANLFVGKYAIPSDGQIKLGPGARVRVLRGIVTSEGWAQDPAGEPWLIVEDDGFWPVMIKLGSQDDLSSSGYPLGRLD
jgi:hypothetical protein